MGYVAPQSFIPPQPIYGEPVVTNMVPVASPTVMTYSPSATTMPGMYQMPVQLTGTGSSVALAQPASFQATASSPTLAYPVSSMSYQAAGGVGMALPTTIQATTTSPTMTYPTSSPSMSNIISGVTSAA